MKALSSLTVAHASDLVAAQKRARRLAGRLGFSEDGQTAVEAALSEVAWTVLQTSSRARVEMSIEREPNRFRITIIDEEHAGEPFSAELDEARTLVDQLEMRSDRTARSIILEKMLPAGAVVMPSLEESSVEGDPALVRAMHMRARAEARLRLSEQRLLLAVDTAQLATWELDPSSGALIADGRCRAMHGLPADGALDLEAMLARVAPSHRARTEETIASVLAAEGPAGFEIEYPVGDGGGVRWLFTRGQVLRAESGPRAIAAVLDISGRHRQEEEARQQAELYQQLVGIVSHDLKNPVQVLIAGLSLLDEARNFDDRQKNVLRRLKSATHRASRLITDLLDFTRDRLGGGMTMEPKRIDLFDVVRDVISSLAFARPDGKIELARDGDTIAELDPDRMEQMVTNLLDNAFEYAAREEQIHVMLNGREDAIEISVFAHGEPITGELMASLFEPLSPAVRQRNRRRVGLGLHIVRAIAEAHGGSAGVSSNLEETRFSVVLPRRWTAGSKSGAPPASSV